MDKEEKLTFWKKLKFSIFDFEKYQDLALEKIIKTIGYIAILVLIFSLIVSGIMTYKVYGACKSIREYIDKNIETIDFADNKLNVVSKQMDEKTVIEDEKLNTKIIIMTLNDEEKINEAIEELNSSENCILILNDKIMIKNEVLTKPIAYSYNAIAERYNINTINKQEAVNLLSYNTLKPLLFVLYGLFLVYIFLIAYLPSVLVDIIILSVFAYIVSAIARMKIKYSALYNISAYSLTLPIILNIIYVIVQAFTGFQIKYFEVMYTTIASIYIATAILIIRSDTIKKQIELTRIVAEQEKVREELKRREDEEKKQAERERQKKEEEKKHKKEKKEEKDDNLGEQPEGNMCK